MPSAGQVRVSLNSGANIHSWHDEFLNPQDLGFESMQQWICATEEQKLQAVKDYFDSQGYPEFSWAEGS